MLKNFKSFIFAIFLAFTTAMYFSCTKEVVYITQSENDGGGDNGGGNNGGNTNPDPGNNPTIDYNELIAGNYGAGTQYESYGFFIWWIGDQWRCGDLYFKSKPNNSSYLAYAGGWGSFSLNNITVQERDNSGSPTKVAATLTVYFDDVEVCEDGLNIGGTLRGFTHNQNCTKSYSIVWVRNKHLYVNGVKYQKNK